MLWTVNHILNTQARLNKLFTDGYATIIADGTTYQEIMSERPGEGAKQEFEWLLNTANIYRLNSEGDGIRYDDMITQGHSVTHEDFGAGVHISRNQFEDDAFGFAGDQMKALGSRMALDPEYECIRMQLAGETLKSYDNQAFYSKNHPINPQKVSIGTYDNLVDDMNDIDSTAYLNNTKPDLSATDGGKYLVSMIAYIRSIKMPNSTADMPKMRRLKPKYLRVPPQLRNVAITLTSADFIGATQNTIKSYQLEVIEVPELAGEPKSWHLDCVQGETPDLLPFVRFIRRQYELTEYTHLTQDRLNEMNEIKKILRGRFGYMYGHPYQSFKMKGA